MGHRHVGLQQDCSGEDPMSEQTTLPKQQQAMPGTTPEMKPVPDHGEKSYRGSPSSPAATAVSAAPWPSPSRVKAPMC